MSNSAFEHVNLKQARRLLHAMTDLARESSLTESLQGGARIAIRQYNGLLAHLSGAGTVPAGLFMPLDEDANFDEAGVACALLGAYIEETDAPPPAPPAPAALVIHNDSQELRELRELRVLLRDQMPDKPDFKSEDRPGPTP